MPIDRPRDEPDPQWNEARNKLDSSLTQADTQTENWCGVLQEVGLPGVAADPSKFLEAAVNYANDRSILPTQRTTCRLQLCLRHAPASQSYIPVVVHLGTYLS